MAAPKIANGNTGTQGPLTLNGGNSVSGNTADLLYVATGANLTISNVRPNTGAVNNTVNLVLGVSGNFNVAGMASISVPISSGTVAAPAANPNGFTKTGAGMLTLSSATNNYSGGTFVNAGTLATSGTGNLGTGNVTLSAAAVLTLGSSVSFADTATLRFTNTTTIQLLNSTADTLATIINSSAPTVVLAPGTYTAAQLNANFGVTTFSGAGSLTVTTAAAVPEPSTWAMSAAMIALAGLTRRRHLGPWLRRACA